MIHDEDGTISERNSMGPIPRHAQVSKSPNAHEGLNWPKNLIPDRRPRSRRRRCVDARSRQRPYRQLSLRGRRLIEIRVGSLDDYRSTSSPRPRSGSNAARAGFPQSRAPHSTTKTDAESG